VVDESLVPATKVSGVFETLLRGSFVSASVFYRHGFEDLKCGAYLQLLDGILFEPLHFATSHLAKDVEQRRYRVQLDSARTRPSLRRITRVETCDR
jgi:hypothetical protein